MEITGLVEFELTMSALPEWLRGLSLMIGERFVYPIMTHDSCSVPIPNLQTRSSRPIPSDLRSAERWDIDAVEAFQRAASHVKQKNAGSYF